MIQLGETHFSRGIHICTAGGRNCGTEESKYAQKSTIQIPTTYPDGDHVLGWAWYGRTVEATSLFGDYYSCTSVMIRGDPLTSSCAPKFILGENMNRATSCRAATNRLGECPKELLLGNKEQEMLPFELSNGREASEILSS